MGEAAFEERLSSLEIVLESFIMSTHVMIREMKNETAKMKQDTAQMKAEMRQDTEKMKAEMTQDTEKMKAEMRQDTEKMKAEMRQDTEKMKAEMRQDTEKMKAEMRQDTEKMKDHTSQFEKNIEKMIADMKQDTINMKRDMNKKWGELANKMGTISEDIVAPNIGGIARQYFNVEDFSFFALNVKCKDTTNPNVVREFDVIAVSDQFFFLNETKSTPKISYANDFIELLPNIYNYFPQYKEKRLIPIFSALHIPDDIKNYLTKHKIYAMAMTDETMDLINFEALAKSE
ncbi:MAG: apolipoprotein A1/A4/E family protein [Desulfamplus sp.]|nr:apolipoprotein A1/A4/E family protein [Desulfamplus sp.]